MLPQKRRIPRSLFGQLLKSKSFGNDLFVLRVAENADNQSRFAVSVSKKTAKKANVRNKMRRFGYRVIGESIDLVRPNLLVQLVWKRPIKTQEEAYVKIKELLKKIQK